MVMQEDVLKIDGKQTTDQATSVFSRKLSDGAALLTSFRNSAYIAMTTGTCFSFQLLPSSISAAQYLFLFLSWSVSAQTSYSSLQALATQAHARSHI